MADQREQSGSGWSGEKRGGDWEELRHGWPHSGLELRHGRRSSPVVGHLQAAVAAAVWPFFLALLAGVFLYARKRARYVEVREDWELERVPELTSCHGDEGCSNGDRTHSGSRDVRSQKGMGGDSSGCFGAEASRVTEKRRQCLDPFKLPKILQHSSSYRIFRHMHGTLNIDKKNN
jgi:hypothetical protein